MAAQSDTLDALIRAAQRAPHGFRAKAKRALSQKIHDMLREETK